MVDKKEELKNLKNYARLTLTERYEKREKEKTDAIISNIMTMEALDGSDIPQVTYLPTNSIFDGFIGGIETGEITCVFGPTKSGKSFWLLAIALSASKNSREPVLYVSCENNIATDKSRIDLLREPEAIYNLGLLNQRSTRLNYEDFFDMIKKLIKAKVYKLVVLDGWNNILPSSVDGSGLFVNGGNFIRDLRDSANESGVPVLINWQLSKGFKREKIEDLTSDYSAISVDIPRTCVASYIAQSIGNGKELLLKFEWSRSAAQKGDFMLSLTDRGEGWNMGKYLIK